MTLGRLSRVLLGIAVAAAMMTPRPGDARAGDGYTVTVRLVLVRGESTARTDSAVWIPPDGGEEDVSRGAQLPAGGTLKVFFPVVTLYLDDAGGNRFVLQCPGCTEDDPLVLTVGDPGDGTPFRQSGGRVTWEIEPVREGLFRILLDVLRGPGEELVPVAVRGTLFRTEAGGGTHALTVAEGSVSYGEGTAARLLEGGE
ncbi:MAG: hypothetical protein FJ098_14090, partial [Deltaproteobacteria bacterium]|nr:hypothetical protein [Deltaproteobacteria bacterium]